MINVVIEWIFTMKIIVTNIMIFISMMRDHDHDECFFVV